MESKSQESGAATNFALFLARRGYAGGARGCSLFDRRQVPYQRSPAQVVTTLPPVLRGQPGRNPGGNDGTTWHLLGRSVRVLAFGLAFLP
jgi:hypothetical protein